MRLPRLLDELGIDRADGSYGKLLVQLARIDTLVIDDWGLAVLDDADRRDLLEVLDDRHGTRLTIVTSQLPIEHWHAAIGDATLADTIRDRLVHNAHQLNLKGGSLRRKTGQFDKPDPSAVKPQPRPRAVTPQVSSLPRTGVQFELQRVSSLRRHGCPVSVEYADLCIRA